MLRSQRRGRDPPCWLSEKEPLVGKRKVNFQRCWLPVSRIGLHRRGVERVNCGPKLLDLGEKGVYSSYTSFILPIRNVDPRVRPENPEKVAQSLTPDYSLGSHVAALGLDFSSNVMGPEFADGVFVGEHGSWNRSDPVGYRVSFVPFSDGRPSGQPIDFVSGFRGEDGKTRGRPVGVTVDPSGALIVADDLANTIWRVVRER